MKIREQTTRVNIPEILKASVERVLACYFRYRPIPALLAIFSVVGGIPDVSV
jgi:uncharacterized membrane protein